MRALTPTLAASAATLILGACASTPGAQPHDMSAAQHEAMAKQSEQASATHLTQYDANANKPETRCGPGGGGATSGRPCWTSIVNPTAEHAKAGSDDQKAAADHRAASQALRDAEPRWGHNAPEMATCPLQPKGVQADVTSTRDGFAVAIRASDADTAREVQRRAEALHPKQ